MSKTKIFVILITAVVFISCSHVTEVKIRVKAQSDIDVKKYNKIAVLPFVVDNELFQKSERKTNEKDSNDSRGKKLAFFLRRILSRNQEINIMDTVKTNSIIAGESIDKSLLEDKNELSDIGGELGVDAIVTGRYKFYSVSEPRTVPVERYSTQFHRYIRETITYFQKTYILFLHVIVVDAKTGKTVFRKSYEPSVSEVHNIGTLIINEAFQDDRVFEKLANKAVSDFAKKITPHYELENRFLVE